MQKWEYMVVRSYGGVVMLVNGEEVAEKVDMQPLGQMLYEFLGERGEDGWEVVGMAGIRSGIELILKRPLIGDEEEESEGTEAE
jgi:hypothetical protein